MKSMRNFIVAFLFLLSKADAQPVIKNYKPFYAVVTYNNADWLVLRSYETISGQIFLAVQPQSLITDTISAKQTTLKISGKTETIDYFKATAYVRSIQYAQVHAAQLQDAGITHGYVKEKGITLTIDLCPSHRELDRIILTSIISEFQKTEIPVPLAISITGRWILTHTEDLNWLKQLQQSGDIAVTWINHSYNHRVSATAPLRDNFLLESGTDINFEILGTELAMLQNGLIPSVFFRFPGLVSDLQVVDEVINFGLIPVGTDAWLAKGQKPNAGSIVLIHGNGNEPIGVKDFLTLLKNKQSEVKNKEWLMYDLRESVEDEFAQ